MKLGEMISDLFKEQRQLCPSLMEEGILQRNIVVYNTIGDERQVVAFGTISGCYISCKGPELVTVIETTVGTITLIDEHQDGSAIRCEFRTLNHLRSGDGSFIQIEDPARSIIMYNAKAFDKTFLE